MTRPLRVLMVTPVFPPARGGIETLAGRIATGLGALFDVEVVALDAPNRDAAWHDALPTHRVKNGPPAGRASIIRLNAAVGRRALRNPPDLLLSMHIRSAAASAALARLRAIPTVQYVHAREVDEFPETARFALSRAQRVIAVSRYSSELAVRAGASARRVVVVPNGVDPAPPRVEQRTARPTIVTVSRLEDRYKGHDVLLRAVELVQRRVPDVQWIVVGDGALRPELEARARDAGLAEVVRFVGAVDDEERDRWLERAWVFAMPSRLPDDGRAGEGFGIVFLEASARALPVVAGRVPGVVDAVEEGAGGVLVDPTSAEELAEALQDILSDPRSVEQLGQAGLARSHGFSWDSICAQVGDVLQAAAAERRAGGGTESKNRIALVREMLLGPTAPSTP